MDRLPAELIAHLCSILPTPELKAIRLCCKSFAELGQASLFESFEFRLWPSRRRLEGFEQLVKTPNIASRLRKLSLTTGVLLEYADYRYWQAQVYKDLTGSWSQNLSSRTPSREEYNAFHTSLQARFTDQMRGKYDLYRWYLDVEGRRFVDDFPWRLSHAINLLSQHTSSISYELIMAEPQITLNAVEQFVAPDYLLRLPEEKDPRKRVEDRRRATLSHLLGFLSAASASTLSPSNLTMRCLPLQLLKPPGEQTALVDSALDVAFKCSNNLDLSISSLPHSDWLSRAGLGSVPYMRGRSQAARRLRELLNRPTDLESLKLELLVGKEAELSFELFDRTNLDLFPRHFLKNLKTLSLSRFSCRWGDLRIFLQEAAKLQHLTLAHARLETGSMVDLVTFMPILRLQTAEVFGRWLVDEDEGEWHAHMPGDFTDCANATVYEGPYAFEGLKTCIEDYMANGRGSCPIGDEATWELHGDTSWHYIPA